MIVHYRDQLKACRCLTDRVLGNPKIKILYDTSVEEVIGEKKVEAIKVKSLISGEIKVIKTDGVLVAIGWDPNTSIFRGHLNLDDEGYPYCKGFKTEIPGVFVCGDLVDMSYRQVVTSCGSGCAAAIEAERYISNLLNH